jgi:hypothetical protein
MIYMLEFLALVGIAVALAASPFLFRLLESIVPGQLDRGRSAAAYRPASAVSKEHSEMRDEIRRATHILEGDRRKTGPGPAADARAHL